MDETSDIITWRKGYSLQGRLADIDPYVQERGHYCIIEFHKIIGQWNIHHDTLRGFPIYYNQQNITNLIPLDFAVDCNEAIYLRSTVSINSIDIIPFNYTPQSLDIDDIVDLVRDELANNMLDFIKYNDNDLCLDLTGGFDVATLQAIIEYKNIPCTVRDIILEGLPVEQTKDALLKHLREIYWGYNQQRMEIRPAPTGNAIVTGYHGDGFLMRSPGYVTYVLHYYGISLAEYMLTYNNTTYMTEFLRSDYIMDKITVDKSDDYQLDNVINALTSDHQMWHYNNQIMILPYKSKKLIEYSFSLDTDSILRQVTAVEIQKKIINSINPALLDTVYKNKNVFQKD